MYDELNFAEKGKHVTLYPYIVFVNPGNMHLKNHLIVSEFCWLHGGIKTVIGNFIHISYYSSIAGGGLCIFEDFVGLSAGVRIITGSELIHGEGLTNPAVPREFRAVTRSFVHLEKHVFLASDVVVHPGVTIGEGAVIGSNSVVTKDIEPWTINVGIPAKPVSKRPSEKMKRLEEELYRKSGVQPFNPSKFLPLKVAQKSIPDIEFLETTATP
ncbi:acyltransferase [bacterium]|nr:acyltransferase [bacterium]